MEDEPAKNQLAGWIRSSGGNYTHQLLLQQIQPLSSKWKRWEQEIHREAHSRQYYQEENLSATFSLLLWCDSSSSCLGIHFTRYLLNGNHFFSNTIASSFYLIDHTIFRVHAWGREGTKEDCSNTIILWMAAHICHNSHRVFLLCIFFKY